MDLSWNSTTGCIYQLLTNATLNGIWGSFGDPVPGDDTSKTVSVPTTGTQQFFKLEVQ